MNANPILARFDLQPSLVCPDHRALFEANVQQAMATTATIERRMGESAAKMQDDFWPEPDSWLAQYRPYIVKDGILQIPIKGLLINNFGYQVGDYVTGYDYVRRAFDRGMADPNVRGIALIIDSGGGEVSGNFDLVDHMYANRNVKPIRSFAADFAYSAAYSIASVGEKITVARTGGVGSIGVVTMHIDMSKMLDERGVKVTFIYFGAHKVDGNSYEALSDDVKARIQARIDELGEIFVSTVARNRGMDAQAVRDTEALTFTATQATSNGLADQIGTLDESVAAFAAELSNRKKGLIMADYTQAQYDEGTAAARAEGLSAGRAEGLNEGRKEGAKNAVDRINAIITSDEGKARPKAALSAALKMSSVDVDDVKAFLADLPSESAESAEGQNQTGKNFLSQMEGGENADLGAPSGENAAKPGSRAAKAVGMLKGPAKAA